MIAKMAKMRAYAQQNFVKNLGGGSARGIRRSVYVPRMCAMEKVIVTKAEMRVKFVTTNFVLLHLARPGVPTEMFVWRKIIYVNIAIDHFTVMSIIVQKHFVQTNSSEKWHVLMKIDVFRRSLPVMVSDALVFA